MQKKYVVSGLGLAVVILLFFNYFSDDKEQKTTQLVAVEAVKASRQKIHNDIEALGTANANESVNITASASEVINKINFTDGQLVRKADVIARLEQGEEQAQLAAINARVEEHKRELARIGSLLENRAASKRDYDERSTLLKIARQEAHSIEARIEDRTLRAPFDGLLGIRRLSVGALVQPGDIITTLDDLQPIKLDFNVPSLFLAALKPGVLIEARTEALEGQVFQGEVESVDTRIDPVTRSVLVRALIPNENNQIRPGLLMQVKLLHDMRDAVVVPEESVVMRQNDHFVMVVHPETLVVEERSIKTGTRRPGIVEVQEGLNEGELVITRGIIRVKPGQKVSIKQERQEQDEAPGQGT